MTLSAVSPFVTSLKRRHWRFTLEATLGLTATIASSWRRCTTYDLSKPR